MDDAEELAALRRLAELEARAGANTPLSQRVGNLNMPPRVAELSRNAVAEAAAGVPDMFLNAPTNALNLGNAIVGTAATAFGRPDLAPNVIEPPNYTRRAFQAAGLIKPQAAPQTPAEGYLSAGMTGATAGAPGGIPGMVAGAASSLAARGVTDLTGNPQLGTVAGVGALPAMNAVSQAGSRSMALADELKSQNAPKLDTMNEVRNAGYTIPPSQTNPSIVNRLLENFGGKAATQQEAALRNESPSGPTARLVREEIRAPSDMGITEANLASLRDQRAQPYRDVAALPPIPRQTTGVVITPDSIIPRTSQVNPFPADLLDALKKARLDAKLHWNEFKRQGSVDAYKAWENNTNTAEGLETQIETAAIRAGHPEMVPALRAARTDIAKIHDVERAMNTDRGEVSALDLAKARDKGVPLTGGLLTAAKMGNAYPKAVQRPEQVGSPAVNNLTAGISSALGGGIGAVTGGWPGATIGAATGAVGVPLAQMGIRKMLLSKPYQNFMGTPSYNAGITPEIASQFPQTPQGHAALLAYILSQQQGQ